MEENASSGYSGQGKCLETFVQDLPLVNAEGKQVPFLKWTRFRLVRGVHVSRVTWWTPASSHCFASSTCDRMRRLTFFLAFFSLKTTATMQGNFHSGCWRRSQGIFAPGEQRS